MACWSVLDRAALRGTARIRLMRIKIAMVFQADHRRVFHLGQVISEIPNRKRFRLITVADLYGLKVLHLSEDAIPATSPTANIGAPHPFLGSACTTAGTYDHELAQGRLPCLKFR